MHATAKKGFTLLELLIVIGILAILSSVAVLVLNPAELLRQARDSSRINDLAAVNNALATYVATVSTVSLGEASIYTHNSGTTSSTFSGAGCAGTSASSTKRTVRSVDGTGWIPVNFGAIPGGAPLSALPVDPVSKTVDTIGTAGTYHLLYWYLPDITNSTWELAAKMESSRYSNGGANDVEKNDGGSCSFAYEVGTDPGLDR